MSAAERARRPAPRPALPSGPFLVAGLGRAGRAAARALSRVAGPDQVRAWDIDTGASMRRLRSELEAEGIETLLRPGLTRREVGRSRTLVKSPGIPFHAPVIQRAAGKGLEVMDELELGWRLSRVPMIAVTGTNGKSTVSGITDAILGASGLRVELAGNTQFGPSLSAVERTELDWIVCEVSSFQLEGCVRMRPEIAVFTNLTAEHLGRHGTLERYGAMKRRLFVRDGQAVSRAIVDVDGAFGRELAEEIERSGGVVTRVGFSAAADYRVESATWDLHRAETRLHTPAGDVSLRTTLPGEYNARNVAAAMAVVDLVGVDRPISVAALRDYVGPTGRFERLGTGQRFDVIVDFAHTPDALEQLLETVRIGMRPGARLTVVLGPGLPAGAGARELGRIAREGADRLILTRYAHEQGPSIAELESVLAGARSARGAELATILDRRRAIEQAVRCSIADEAIVIPGRGALPDLRHAARGPELMPDDLALAREVVAQAAERALVPQSLSARPRRLRTARSPSRAL